MPTLEKIIGFGHHKPKPVSNKPTLNIIGGIIKMENEKMIDKIALIKGLTANEIATLKEEFIKPNYYCPQVVNYSRHQTTSI